MCDLGAHTMLNESTSGVLDASNRLQLDEFLSEPRKVIMRELPVCKGGDHRVFKKS